MKRAMIPLAAAGALSACVSPEPTNGPGEPAFLGIETQLLDGDLVNFIVQMQNPNSRSAVEAYAECAAAQYTLIRGYGFARHVRTKVHEEGGIWAADAVYTISPSLPRGVKTIDAEVVVQNCTELGIPTV